MIVCHCLVLNDHDIWSVVDQGAVTVEDVVRTCGAGRKCAGCRPTIRWVLERGRPVGEQAVALAAS